MGKDFPTLFAKKTKRKKIQKTLGGLITDILLNGTGATLGQDVSPQGSHESP